MGRLILAVEDDPGIAGLYRAIFAGDRVLVAETAVQALSLIEQELPDLVILDLALRGSHGRSVIEGLGTRRPPVLVVSAQHDSDAIARAIGADLVRKPFDVDQLMAKAERLLTAVEHQVIEEALKDG